MVFDVKVDVNITINDKTSVLDVQAINGLLNRLVNQGVHTVTAIDDLTREVAETKTIMSSAVTLIVGLAQAVRDAAGPSINPQLAALATELDTSANALAAAVAANPATVAPVVPVVPDPNA